MAKYRVCQAVVSRTSANHGQLAQVAKTRTLLLELVLTCVFGRVRVAAQISFCVPPVNKIFVYYLNTILLGGGGGGVKLDQRLEKS